MWHVSVSIWNQSAMLHPDRWNSKQRKIAELVLRAALRGVGTGKRMREERAEMTVQYRKFLSADELRLLPQDKLPNQWTDHDKIRGDPV